MKDLFQARPTMDTHRSYSDESEDTIFFHLQDISHEFTMGLGDILKCVQLAEKKGFVPPLPDEWWNDVSDTYIDFRKYNEPPEDED